MVNKLKSNKGSAMTTAILIMILVASIGIITTLMMSSNMRITLRRVNERIEIVRVENEMYEVLNSYSSLPIEKTGKCDINSKEYDLKIAKETGDGNIYIFSISFEGEAIVECKVQYEIDATNSKYYYSIKSWSV